MPRPKTDLQRIVGDICDGSPIEWESEYRDAPTPRPLLDELRVIESIVTAHREVSTEAMGEADAEAGQDVPTPAAKQIGHYTVERVLGRGGMGVVYLARDTRLDRSVAIKALPAPMAADRDGLRRFEREAKLLASLSHPHIATVYGLEVTDEGRLYLVMERVDGVTLSERLRGEPLGILEAIDVCAAVASALEAAHESGVIHRDLKPSNIIVGPRGAPKVLDFGLARRVSDAPSSLRVGTPGYMSPEQVTGSPQDERVDIFAFGCLLYECLTGRRAFPGATPSDRLASVLDAEPDWGALPEGTPRSLGTLLKRCLNKNPERRCSMSEARRELEAPRGAVARRRRSPARG